jgi:hypothetical protein
MADATDAESYSNQVVSDTPFNPFPPSVAPGSVSATNPAFDAEGASASAQSWASAAQSSANNYGSLTFGSIFGPVRWAMVNVVTPFLDGCVVSVAAATVFSDGAVLASPYWVGSACVVGGAGAFTS